MADGQNLQAALFEAMGEAQRALCQMVPLGVALAEAEREYRVQKRTRTLWERSGGAPVTIIGDLVCGCDDIAALRLKRDCAQAEYDANREALLLAKKRIDTIREMIAREWSANGNDQAWN
ncbi:hypothetical protein [Adlercreutzia caecimuris]|jgi:hypothetical protein|uniref:hypothetical protein n=1 Tax=Adlercreutzia caecimuris TaxID=671266 RepID=UPI001364BA5B|nr:hypothetical protein [Adlercreutzia caecimuris]NBJ67751.1 hypothetical protein [Adlercreutzia caecimuris]